MIENNFSKLRSKTVQNNTPLVTVSILPKAEKQISNQNIKKNHQTVNKNFSLSQSNKLDNYISHFSTRASGKISSVSPTNQYKNFKTQVQTMQSTVKQNLKSLNYRQKLINIEALVKNCKELCQQYGYFYITYAMLFYDPFVQIKLSVWIHPDIRVTKCLHPIHKNTQYEKEIQFIQNLKLILKQFFPTIFLGNGRTFTSLLIHINQLKIPIFTKKLKNKSQYFQYLPVQPTKIAKRYSVKQSRSNEALGKKYFNIQKTITEEAEQDEEKQFQTKKIVLTQKKNYKSFKSEKPIQLKSPTLLIKHQSQISKTLINPEKIQTNLEKYARILNEQQNQGYPITPKVNHTQIEDDLNNLFGSSNFPSGFYGKEKGYEGQDKKSMIKNIAEQFGQLF